MTYKIAIPSLGRSHMCVSHTLKTLADNGIPPDKITVFIVADEHDQYCATIPDNIELVIGHRGIIQQRKFIEAYYPVDTNLVSIDDDIEQIDISLTDYTCLDEFFVNAFEDLIASDTYLWGIYPVWNPFFRKQRQSINRCLSFIVGCMFGIRVRRCEDISCQITAGQKEDVERSIRTFRKDGSVVRYERIGVKTKYFSKIGGLGDFESRFHESNKDSVAICDAFPHHTKLRIRKSDGRHEVKFRKIPNHNTTDIITMLPKLDESVFTTLYQLLSLIKIPLIKAKSDGGSTRRGFPTHRAMCIGLVRQRMTGKVCQSAASFKYPELYAEVFRIGNLICPFEFTSVHINHNVVCPPHIDSLNTGDSCLVSFGEYGGGNLFVEGNEYNLKHQPAVFNGSSLIHWNAPLDNNSNKYSLVFYSH